jgi:lipoprotein-releasing system permease protein
MRITALPVELFIAVRYLKARKKGFFSILTTLIAIGGTTLGVAALIIALAVMSGFQNDIRNKILGVQPHIIVARADGRMFGDYLDIGDKIKTDKDVLEVSPFICKQGVISGGRSASTSAIMVKAIDYESENGVVKLSRRMVVSDINFNGRKVGEESIILGSELARNIGVNAGDKVVLMFPSELSSIPRMYEFVVSAVMESGMYDFDSSLGLVDLEEGRKLFSMQDEITGFDVQTSSFNRVLTVASRIRKNLFYPYVARTWIEMNKSLFSALRLEKIMMFLVLALIILVAAFNVISNLLLLGVQKSKEIGIMSAVGFSKFSISKIFFYEGIIIGLAGIFLGIASGLVGSFTLKYFNIFKLPKGVYYVDKLPVVIVPLDVTMVAVSAFIIAVIAGIYPAYQVAKLEPLEAIRYS